jgi:RNA polymerase sigma factor (TIGR02999 family)
MSHQDSPSQKSITGLLQQWRSGDQDAVNKLMPLIYDQLHTLAWRFHHGDGGDVTLRPTVLVHEAFLRLQGSDLEFVDRTHFFAVAALTRRRLLVDFARHRLREKRGGGMTRVEFSDSRVSPQLAGDETYGILALDEAMELLAQRDARKARIVEMHFFAGLSYDEIADVLGISAATVGRELKFAKAWLGREIEHRGTP